MNLEQKIEGLLFYTAEPMAVSSIAKMLGANKDEVISAVEKLKESLGSRGIVLVQKEEEISLGTHPEMHELIEKIRKEELSKELSKASVETLSIVLYNSGVTRSEIDFIRGVNSSFILRNLSIRGLVERVPDPKDSRRATYKPTFELMQMLGISDLKNLPDYEAFSKTLTERVDFSNNEI